MIRLDAGDLQLTLLDGGSIWLDGGAMFGVVPRELWRRARTPDDKNRIQLALNVLLIDDGKRKTLIDTGAGTKWDDRSRAIFRVDERSAEDLVGQAGLRPENIDRVINTHLHFDHAGGNTVRAEDGSLQPAFPNAEYFVQRGELEIARRDNERLKAAYPAENFEPLDDVDGRLRLLDGDSVLDGTIHLELAPGHTPFMQMVLLHAGPTTLAFLADLVPMTSHLPLSYIMAYDLDPLATLETKKVVLNRAVTEGWRVIFEHDPLLPVATLEQRDGRLTAVPHEVC